MLAEQQMPIPFPTPHDHFPSIKHENSSISVSSISTIETIADRLPKTQTFYQYKQGYYCICPVTLAADSLTIKLDQEMTFPLADVLGATVKKAAPKQSHKGTSDNEQLYKLNVYCLPKVHKSLLTKDHSFKRKLQKFELYIWSENIAKKWQNLILQAANNPHFLNLWETHSYEDLPIFKRKLLVFVNPHSGKNQAMKNWAKAKKLLRKAGCEFQEIFTQYSKHAKEYMLKYPAEALKEINGLVTVSGDGLMHEIINGFYSRPDWEELREIPFGIIPSGTSNALIRNLLEKTDEMASVKSACLIIAKGRCLKSDLTVLEKEDGSKIFGFLIFAWATMAQIDVGSNDLRSLGRFRFTVYGIWNLLAMKKYQAKFSYTTKDNVNLPKFHEKLDQNWKTLHDSFRHLSIHNLAWIADKYRAVPLADFQDGVNHMLALGGDKISRTKLAKTLAKLEGSLFKNDQPIPSLGLAYEKVKAFRIEPYGKIKGHFAIDGEGYEVTSIQGKVLEKTLTLFCPQ